MADEQAIRDALRWQRDFCLRSGAPITARVCAALAELLDRSSATGRRALDWPGEPIADALPLRLAGGFHALHRSGRCPALAPVYRGEAEDARGAVRAAITEHDAELVRWMDGPPQTNEPARSGVLMAGLLALAARHRVARFELIEIGSSAGLNLLIDRYRFDLGGTLVGPAESPVAIRPEWRGPPPVAAGIEIASVRGVDIAPIDLSGDPAVERLLAYVWADNHERFARLEKAIAMWRAAPPRLDRGDAADWVEARLAEPQPEGVLRVLMHSIVWQYLSPGGQRRIEAAMAAAGERATASRPLGWIAYEGQRGLMTHGLTVRSWPGHPGELEIASAHPHGAWIEWAGLSSASFRV